MKTSIGVLPLQEGKTIYKSYFKVVLSLSPKTDDWECEEGEQASKWADPIPEDQVEDFEERKRAQEEGQGT